MMSMSVNSSALPMSLVVRESKERLILIASETSESASTVLVTMLKSVGCVYHLASIAGKLFDLSEIVKPLPESYNALKD